MNITVKLHGVFRIDRFKESRREVTAGCRVAEVIAALQLSPQLLDIILVNGVHTDAAHILQEGDVLTLLPLLDGG